MPSFLSLQFLTLLALNIFHRESVDVAIVEVGIGGLYDTTNVVRKPVVCGITSLGIDHTALLGSTIEEIARHKAGIMKEGQQSARLLVPPPVHTNLGQHHDFLRPSKGTLM